MENLIAFKENLQYEGLNRLDGVFEKHEYVSGLSNGRNLSSRSIDRIVKIVHLYCDSLNQKENGILDIGCGAGRFSIPMALSNSKVKVYCLDSSAKMISSLLERAKNHKVTNIETIQEDFFEWRPKIRFNIAFMSAFIHLFESKSKVFQKVASALNPGSFFILRSPLPFQLRNSEIFQRVPESLKIYEQTHPNCEKLNNLAREVGFDLVNITPLAVDLKISRGDFLEIFYKKKHSAFWRIPNEVYRSRIDEIEKSTSGLTTIDYRTETSIIIFQKN